MNPYECYNEYLALKNHFTKPGYDYQKYNGKLRTKVDTFQKRKDRIFFEKLAKHEDVHNFLVANLAENPKAWIRDLAYSQKAEEVYQKWRKRNQSLGYIFKNEVGRMMTPFNDNFIHTDGEHPHFLRNYLSGRVSMETFCIMLELTNSKKYWDKKMAYDPIWDEISMRVDKYTPFIRYDKDKFRKIVVDIYGKE